jgi:aspartyl-tRNA(Asn)/glutamyl-tRNA(Gln) amidotransferase subunit B
MGPIKARLNELSLTESEIPLSPVTLAELIRLVEENLISFSVASQQVLPELMKKTSLSALEVAQQLNVIQDTNTELIGSIIDKVLIEFPTKVVEYKRGKRGLLTFFMGEVMKKSSGKADPQKAKALLSMKLEELK